MRAEEFSKILLGELEGLTKDDDSTLESAREISSGLLQIVARLRNFIIGYTFENSGEEIRFFKYTKAEFFVPLIYYQSVFEILSAIPVALQEDINAYYLRELKRIRKYMESNKRLLKYYRSGSRVLDDIYFVRRPPDLWLSLTSGECNDPLFTTLCDHKLSTVLAYEKVGNFIIGSISPSTAEGKAVGPSVTWTGSKASLIELLYALQTSGACNNGTIDVKQLATHFEHIFNVRLGNFYRTFQEIRIRKISRTTFLDQLKENLIKRMDNSDENPKY